MLERDLQDIGFNEKEAKVYLSALELGSATAQQISDKSKIKRATTYFVMEKLMSSGVMSSFHKGKKQFFVAEDPKRLDMWLDFQKNKIEQQREQLKRMLPELQSINNREGSDVPVVKFYEGKKGVLAMNYDFFDTEGGEFLTFIPMDKVKDFFSSEDNVKLSHLMSEKKVSTRMLYTKKEGEHISDYNVCKIPLDEGLENCEIAVYNNHVAFVTYTNRVLGILIDDVNIADGIRKIFNIAWDKYKK